MREALIKAAGGDISRWPDVAPSVFWAERVTIQKSTGYSPYYLAHGVELLLPFDSSEATYLAPSLDLLMTTVHGRAHRTKSNYAAKKATRSIKSSEAGTESEMGLGQADGKEIRS